MPPDPMLRRKLASIERCLDRVATLIDNDPSRLDDQTIEDAVVLNLQRACEATIAAAMRVVARLRLGLPQDSREAFTMLERAALLEPDLADRMRAMVGFRNVAVRACQELDRAIVKSIATEHRADLQRFGRAVLGIDLEPGDGSGR